MIAFAALTTVIPGGVASTSESEATTASEAHPVNIDADACAELG
jgi:hypothetical protein